ncbi:hypothetical protein ABZY44_37330 [Streptomyces sp. NPDC006544]|uniref:hypothetical protein n=1 Tax=Streptomyces sp. NPDC006544 TaxID=3154583 RepID=UPI0033AD1350
MHADDRIAEVVSADLATLLRNADASRPVQIAPSVCGGGGGRVFFVPVDDVEGGAERVYLGCGGRAFLADSEEFWEDADPGEAGCPCGGVEFETAVAFSLADDGSVRWVTVGLRCPRDGAVGIHADWQIDYAPTHHLLTLVQIREAGPEQDEALPGPAGHSSDSPWPTGHRFAERTRGPPGRHPRTARSRPQPPFEPTSARHDLANRPALRRRYGAGAAVHPAVAAPASAFPASTPSPSQSIGIATHRSLASTPCAALTAT